MFKNKLIPFNVIHTLLKCTFVFAIVFFVYAMGYWVFNSSYFPIKHISVNQHSASLRHVSDEEIDKILQQYIFENFFKVNLNSMKADFEQEKWIHEANIIRNWPNRINIDLVEKEPIAKWKNGQVVDQFGFLFDVDVTEDLILFSGPDDTQKIMTDIYLQMKPILRNKQLNVVELRMTKRSSWCIRLDNDVLVYLGRENIIENLKMVVSSWDQLIASSDKKIHSIFAEYYDGFSVKYKD